jgi:hypothetical protein
MLARCCPCWLSLLVVSVVVPVVIPVVVSMVVLGDDGDSGSGGGVNRRCERS